MNADNCDLQNKTCKPCEGGMLPMGKDEISRILSDLDGWASENNEISKTYTFKNFHETMDFVNAVASIAHQEDHHPNLEVSYKTCVVRYSTHAIGGLSENDFICAAKIEALLENG
jgi:4a-hydroxytetrahydrobiopterin dehydratase